MVGNAERFLAAVQDQWDDEVFLIVQMAQETAQQRAACVRIIIGHFPELFTAGLQRSQHYVGFFGGSFHIAMNVMMVTFQDIEAASKPRIRRSEERKVMKVLNLVMHVELVQHELKSRHELPCKFHGWHLPCREISAELPDRAREFAKHRVARQPKSRHCTKISVTLPSLAWIAGNQDAHFLWPAPAPPQRESCNIQGIGWLVTHRNLNSHCATKCEEQTSDA